MSVNLCGGKAGVTQHGLNATEISSTIKKMGGKTVPQFMRTDIDRNIRVRVVFFK
jgi:hypothetical protein